MIFINREETMKVVYDKNTKLFWTREENLKYKNNWRLPTINETESLYHLFTNKFKHSLFKIPNFRIKVDKINKGQRFSPNLNAVDGYGTYTIEEHYVFDFKTGEVILWGQSMYERYGYEPHILTFLVKGR